MDPIATKHHDPCVTVQNSDSYVGWSSASPVSN